MPGILQEDGDPHCFPAGAHSLLGEGGGRLTNLCTRHTQNELRAVGAQQSRESSSLRDLGAASERRPQMIRALKDVRGDKDRACFVREE